LISKYGGGELTSLMNDFLTQLAEIQKQSEIERLVNESNLIHDHESKQYDFIDKKGTYFNSRRACFLDGMNSINRMLSHHPYRLKYWTVKNSLQKNQTCNDPSHQVIINQMIELSLIKQDRETTELYL
jgi:hypothetical protein